jgi:molybdate transport system substrate-binding protein
MPNRNLTIGLVVIVVLMNMLLATTALAAPKREVQVFAASVMTEAFTELKGIFEKSHPGVEVKIQFAATSLLRTQVENGAKPDVFESADERSIKALWQNGLVPGRYQPMAYNRLAVIVPTENRKHIASLSDLTKPGITLVGCAPEVPVGGYTLQLLDNLDKSGKFGRDYKKRVQANFRSLEPNVKGIVAKVLTGDADAGFCYASDINANVKDKVSVIPIPEQYNVKASHYISLIKECKNADLGKQFISLTLSPQGQAVFARNGMIPVKGAKPAPKVK